MMKHISILIAAVLLASCSTHKPPTAPLATPAATPGATPAAAPPTPATTTANPPRGMHPRQAAAATADRIGADSFDIPFSELLSHFDHDATRESDGYLWVMKAGKPLFGMSDKNDLQDRKVRLIYLISPDIQVGNGVHAGMPIEALLQKYPNLELDIGYNDDEMFSLPGASSAGKNLIILAIVRSKDGGRLASDDPARRAPGEVPYPTRHFSTAGRIDHFLIFAPSPRQ